MSNLSIENLNRIVQGGDVEGLMGGARSSSLGNAAQGPEAPGPGGMNFSDLLQDSLNKVNTDQMEADQAMKELVAGRNKNIHETLLTVERADTSLKLMMQVRNKVLDAYREIMRMQV